MSRLFRELTFIGVVGLLMAGCATTYEAQKPGCDPCYGYRVEKEGTTYRVAFSGNKYVTDEKAVSYANRAAQDTCSGAGLRYTRQIAATYKLTPARYEQAYRGGGMGYVDVQISGPSVNFSFECANEGGNNLPQ